MNIQALIYNYSGIEGNDPLLTAESLAKISTSLRSKELILSAYKGTIHLFIYTDKPGATNEHTIKVLEQFINIRIDGKSEKSTDDSYEAVTQFLKLANGIDTKENYFELIQSLTESISLSKKASTFGPVFQRLFQKSISLHEKIRMKSTYYNISDNASLVFCELSEKIFESLNNLSVQTIGYTAEQLNFINSLFAFGCRRFIFSGSDTDYNKAIKNLSTKIALNRSGSGVSNEADIIMLTETKTHFQLEEQISSRMEHRNNSPLLILNFNSNSNVYSISKLFNIFTYELTDLQSIVERNQEEKLKILREVDRWIELETEDFLKIAFSNSLFKFDQIIGQSIKMQEIFELISKISQTDISVLIEGDSGTGKELVSKAIHKNSSRSKKPFIVVNCGAIPENLLESELFGHIRGSFTGAVSTKNGLFKDAHNGTIFLDEIAELPHQLQVKLLRFLQEGEIKPVGSNETKKIDARVLAATNKNLKDMVSKGIFRSDLYYRLDVIHIKIPALKERSDDIPMLAAHFLKKYADKFNKEVKEFSREAFSIIQNYSWPGNVRELENAVERAVALSLGKQILPFDLPASIKATGPEIAGPFFHNGERSILKLKDMEKKHIIDTLNHTSWDYEKACTLLGIGRTTLWRKLKEYKVTEITKLH